MGYKNVYIVKSQIPNDLYDDQYHVSYVYGETEDEKIVGIGRFDAIHFGKKIQMDFEELENFQKFRKDTPALEGSSVRVWNPEGVLRNVYNHRSGSLYLE